MMNQLSKQPLGDSLGDYEQNEALHTTLYLASIAASAALAYHGYKRNDSVGWAIVWGLIGGAFWPIAVPVAVAQGYGEKVR